MRKIFIVSLILIGVIQLQAQDRLFSQFYASPLTLNPALTGAFEGKFRVSAIYRDQWRSVMENSYATFSSGLDLRWRMGRNTSRYKDHAAVGVMFFNDKAGALNFSTTQISVSGAYHKALDIRNTQILSLGFQAGIAQRNINFGNVTFEDQFNGTTGYSDPTAERLPENNYAFADYSVGLNYVYSPKASKMRVFAGAAMHHFLSPSVSFFHKSDSDTDLPDNLLATRYSGQLSAQFPVSKGISILPRMIFDKQDEHMKLDAGANFRLNTSEYRNVAIHVGGYVRPVTDQDNSFRMDAVVGLVGLEFNNVLIGMSYDVYLGRTSNFSRGSFEFSVAYLGEYEDDLILCPKF
jgi:type IX secretion system PorP/SprF family membrane protein